MVSLWTPGALFAAIQSHFADVSLPNPVKEIEFEFELDPVTNEPNGKGWACLNLHGHVMKKPSAETIRRVEREKENPYESGLAVCGDQVPKVHFHGTSPQRLMVILEHGTIYSKGQLLRLGLPCEKGVPHKPDGVYSYSNLEVSNKSQYTSFGAQVAFTTPSTPYSYNYSRAIDEVPEGVCCRLQRSAFKTEGAKGAEWVHNSNSIAVVAARVKLSHLDQLFESEAPGPVVREMGPWETGPEIMGAPVVNDVILTCWQEWRPTRANVPTPSDATGSARVPPTHSPDIASDPVIAQ
jgi:hypothetical protein